MIAFLGVLSTYFMFSKMERDRHFEYQRERYTLVANSFLSDLQFFPKKSELEKKYRYFLVKPIDKKKGLEILKNAKPLFYEESIFGNITVLEYKNDNFIYIQSFDYALMLQDIKPKEHIVMIALMLFLFFNAVLILIYGALRKKLTPLKELDFEVQKFAKGELNPDIKDYGDDEIGKIAKSFKMAVKSIKEHIESKNLFMRNMMHELKTPLTKGRIVAESIEDMEDKDILVGSFDRMNEIITNLANIEKFTSKQIPLRLKPLSFNRLIQNACGLLMLKEDEIIKEYEDFQLNVDEEYFTIVLKNLIDNGIKFSTDQKVIIKADKKKIEIISKAKPLEQPLSYYLEPFSQEQKRDSGFGLGLYIVKSILDRHHIALDYAHKDGKNIFTLILDKTL